MFVFTNVSSHDLFWKRAEKAGAGRLVKYVEYRMVIRYGDPRRAIVDYLRCPLFRALNALQLDFVNFADSYFFGTWMGMTDIERKAWMDRVARAVRQRGLRSPDFAISGVPREGLREGLRRGLRVGLLNIVQRQQWGGQAFCRNDRFAIESREGHQLRKTLMGEEVAVALG